ncbi:CHRD domain-containing protein [Herbidospora mongoliensis]|uniref:CHRD domain-containing protein n=1 Tax=Herbidospora mongoliensis TaxID=688067 RepID=UPI000829C0B5|nr:CHRD domain-containing protein [Herbidospora mongoliensis]
MLRTLIVPGLALAAAVAATPAAANPGHEHGTPATSQSTQANALSGHHSSDAYFAATLLGKNEVPAAGAKVGDKNGIAVAAFRIRGNKVEYAIRWQGTAAPSAFHIHQGKKGANGDVKIPFFGSALPTSLSAVKGIVTINDAGLLNRIKNNPSAWYANLHTAEFPGGAVRAQLHRIKPVELDTVLATGSRSTLTAIADGRQEVPAPGTKVGDKNGKAVWLVWAKGTKVHFATVWENIAAPTLAHIHKAPKGKNGPVAVDFFAASAGLPAGINGLAGTATASSSLVKRINKAPKNWYTNLHTAEFPGGAVRGQLYGGRW